MDRFIDTLGKEILWPEDGGVCCPRCGGNEIEGNDGVEIDAGIAWQDVTCLTCDLEWRGQYNLVGIQMLRPNLLGPDGEFIKTHDYVERNSDGSWTIFQGCGGDYEGCEDHWVDISLETEDDVGVVYFRAYDNSGRRGNMSVPVVAMRDWLTRRALNDSEDLDVEHEDEYGSVIIDLVDGMLYLSTGPYGDFQMPFGDDGIEAIVDLIRKESK